MYKIIFIVSSVLILNGAIVAVSYAGCAGDCMTCHQSIKNDITHLSLKTCINCHKPSSLDTLSSNAGCGNRCFQCHEQWPKDSSHASLDKCLNCHKK